MMHQRRLGTLRNSICQGLIISRKITIYTVFISQTEARFKTRAAVQQQQSAALLYCRLGHLLNKNSFSVCVAHKLCCHISLQLPSPQDNSGNSIPIPTLYGCGAFLSVNSTSLLFHFFLFLLPLLGFINLNLTSPYPLAPSP